MACIYFPEIVHPPESVVVFSGNRVEFSCGTRSAPVVTWKVNGTLFNQLNASLRADLGTSQQTVGDLELYTLLIPAGNEYNGIVIQCVAGVFGGTFIMSENATLMIQGS